MTLDQSYKSVSGTRSEVGCGGKGKRFVCWLGEAVLLVCIPRISNGVREEPYS